MMRRPVELSFVFTASMEPQLQALWLRAFEAVKAQLQRTHSKYEWRVVHLQKPLEASSAPDVLHKAVALLATYRVDFVIVISDAPIQNPQGQQLGALASSVLNVAITTTPTKASFANDELDVATDTGSEDPSSAHYQCSVAMASQRILLLFAALNGVAPNEWVSKTDGVFLSKSAMSELDDQFASVADERLEERDSSSLSELAFRLRSLIAARRELASTILRGRPWMFPFRLPKLMAGAASAALIVMLTAEAWQLGAAQSWTSILAMATVPVSVAERSPRPS